jgi:GT2 family glycosyltransferase
MPVNAQPELSIIIVNWNSAEHLHTSLASIFEKECSFLFEVLVIDNGSYDGCGEMLRHDFPRVRFLQSPQNLGFAAANNRAFAFTAGKNLLFLNPDTEVTSGALQRMMDVLGNLPEAGIVGPRLVGPDLKPQPNCMRTVPTLLNQLLDTNFSRRIFPPAWGCDVMALKSHAPVAVQVVPGTCLMVRREVFTAAGLFDPAYFMYAEDVDLCCQARKLGWKVYYLHDAVVIHQGGASSRRQEHSAFAAVLMRQSVHKFLDARRGSIYAHAYRALTGLGALCRLLFSGALFVADRGERPRWRTATTKWLRVLRWSLGLETWAAALTRRRGPAAQPGNLYRAVSPLRQG